MNMMKVEASMWVEWISLFSISIDLCTLIHLIRWKPNTRRKNKLACSLTGASSGESQFVWKQKHMNCWIYIYILVFFIYFMHARSRSHTLTRSLSLVIFSFLFFLFFIFIYIITFYLIWVTFTCTYVCVCVHKKEN